MVTMTTGMSAVAASAFSAASTAQPSMPGIITSSVMASGASSRASRSASSPRAGRDHAEALAPEEALHQLADRRVVVDHQHRAPARVAGPSRCSTARAASGAGSSTRAGRRRANVLPGRARSPP